VAAVNAKGGVGGRPLKPDFCDTRADPNGAAECARKAVANGSVASLSSFTNLADSVVPVLNKADIASIGPIASSAADLTNPNGFTFLPAAVTLVPGQGNLAASLGKKKIGFAVTQVPQAAQLVQLAGIGLAPYKLKPANTVQIPVGTPDMSSYAAAAMAGGTDAIAVVLAPTDGANFVQALRDASFKGAIVCATTTVVRDIDAGFGELMEGVYAVDNFRPASETRNSAVKRMVDEISASGYDGPIDQVLENAWASVHLLAQVAGSITAVDAASVLAALPTTTFDIGIMPPVDFSKPITTIPGLHIFNPNVYYEQVKDGQVVGVTGRFTDFLSP
jgi:ABC-type branched-subunit amino acid transport system substrate-binding protein